MLVPATIKINFSAIYILGCHRVCYSTNPLGPFDTCLEETFSSGANTFEIPIMVDPESCDPVSYYGYIQACCEDEDSENGRVAWTATYTPTPTCIGVRVTATTDVLVKSVSNTCDNPGEFNGKRSGTSFVVCYNGGVAGSGFAADDADPVTGWTARGYSAVDDLTVCCNNCYTYEVNCGAGAIYQYINCLGQIINETSTGIDIICAKQDSISEDITSPNPITINLINTTCTAP